MKRFALTLAISVATATMALPVASQQVVDDALLRNPPPGEWLTHGLNYAENRFSPLTRITPGNVSRLTQAWVYDIPGGNGQIESTPLVHDGIMYAAGTWSYVFALDAKTGEVIWRWDPAVVRGGVAQGGMTNINGAPSRGLALYNGKVYAGIQDGRLVALDAKTGDVIWVRQTTPYGNSEYQVTGAPRIANGKVIIGNGGAEFHGVRGYVTAYDAETGEQAWRFYTVPGDPSLPWEQPAMEMAARTWAGEWWKLGGGGTAWDAITFDPEANLVYIGTGNGSPWSHVARSNGIGDNLFLNSIVAVNADTGEYVWHYQTVPADKWDYTTTMHMIQADVMIEGRLRKVIMQVPKTGFLYVLDRLTGELLSAEKISEYITWASHYDMTTGRPVLNPVANYDTIGSWISPGAGGVHSWQPMSFSPLTGLVYIPGQNGMQFYRQAPTYTIPAPGQQAQGLIRGNNPAIPRPENPPVAGFLAARNPVTQRDAWRIDLPVGRFTGMLTTASNLLFTGRRDNPGSFQAYNAATGEKLWEAPISNNGASPITYEIDGRQYVTIMTAPATPNQGIAGRVFTFVLPE